MGTSFDSLYLLHAGRFRFSRNRQCPSKECSEYLDQERFRFSGRMHWVLPCRVCLCLRKCAIVHWSWSKVLRGFRLLGNENWQLQVVDLPVLFCCNLSHYSIWISCGEMPNHNLYLLFVLHDKLHLSSSRGMGLGWVIMGQWLAQRDRIHWLCWLKCCPCSRRNMRSMGS